MGEERRIEVGRTADGAPVSLPVERVLTGRAAILGKSGSGKSNTASVVIEELLEAGYPVLVVDTDGEYYGLKEEYELLHAGADEGCDIQVGAEHAERIAGLALEEGVPVILDVSGYLDEGEASELIRETARHLFAKEKKLKRPFLLVVEEVHEYVPEGGGLDETGRMLIKVGKRGRKHGLGIVGISQRPADVKKDFITQANWLVWHRLTWENDTKVVGRVVGGGYADAVADLDDGEAFVQRDWTDDEVSRVRFDRKRTFDAGATPGLDEFERPDLKSVSESLVDDLQDISRRRDRREGRIAELESKLEDRERRIEELEEELRAARNVSRAARRMADALHGDGERSDDGERSREGVERIRALEAEVESLRSAVGGPAADDATPAGVPRDGRDHGGANGSDGTAASAEASDGTPGSGRAGRADGETADGDGTSEPAPRDTPELVRAANAGLDGRERIDLDEETVDEHVERLRRRGERLLAAESGAASTAEAADLLDDLYAGPVVARIDGAQRASLCNHERAWAVIAALVSHGSVSLPAFDPLVDASRESVESLLSELRSRSLVVRDGDGRYSLNGEELRRLSESEGDRSARSELAGQWNV